MKKTKTSEALDGLQIYLGKWKITGINISSEENSVQSPVSGENHVKVMAGGKFLESRWKYHFESGEHIGISIIGHDSDALNITSNNFDNLGFHRVYYMDIKADSFKLNGETERATFEFDNDGKTYKEVWEIKKHGTWKPLCERTGTKI